MISYFQHIWGPNEMSQWNELILWLWEIWVQYLTTHGSLDINMKYSQSTELKCLLECLQKNKKRTEKTTITKMCTVESR